MGRKKKIISNENKKLEIDSKAESTQTNVNSEKSSDVTGNMGATSEIEKEIEEIMQPFSEENSEVKFTPESEIVTPENGDADFIPKRERKKRETKKEKEEKERVFKLPGKLVNRATNRLMAGIVVTIDGWVSKNPIPVEYIMMPEEDMNDEDTVAMAEEFIKALNLSGNPIAMYLGVMGAGILTNLMLIKSMMKQAERKGEKVKFETNEENTEK